MTTAGPPRSHHGMTAYGCRYGGGIAVLRTAGSVAFVNCSMVEASLVGCRWDKAVLDGCRLSGVEFDHCDLRGTDLRGNSLETVRGVGSLRGVTLTADQVADLAAALVADLDLRIRQP